MLFLDPLKCEDEFLTIVVDNHGGCPVLAFVGDNIEAADDQASYGLSEYISVSKREENSDENNCVEAISSESKISRMQRSKRVKQSTKEKTMKVDGTVVRSKQMQSTETDEIAGW